MITYIIIAITVVFSVIGFRNRSFFYGFSLNPYSVIKRNQWYRLLTHGFLHGDYMHLFVNMFVLWSFGSSVENTFNSLQQSGIIGNAQINFVVLYVGALLFASIPDMVKRKDQHMYNSIGASGAVSAIVFASIFFSPWSKIYFFAVLPIPSILFGVFYLWYEQYMSRRGGDKVNHAAHIYGAIFGILYLILMAPSLLEHFITALKNIQF